MALEDSLDAYLSECQFDSQGCFTLDGRTARQGGQGSEYLLQMVQAAVAGGASRIDIKTARDRLEVHCNLGEAPSAVEVAEALRRPLENHGATALTLLVRAVFRASLQPVQHVVWARSGKGLVVDREGRARLLDLPCRGTLLGSVCGRESKFLASATPASGAGAG